MHFTTKSSQSSSYQGLKSWYLARLRKAALAAQAENDMTPATLVLRDRQALEDLIAEAAQPTPEDTPRKREYLPWVFCAFIVTTNILMLIWLVFDEPCLPALIPTAKAVLILLLLLSTVPAFACARLLDRKGATLAAMTQREDAIADYALDPFWSVDSSYKFIAASPAMHGLLGYQGNELINISFIDLVPDVEKERIKQTFDGAINNAKSGAVTKKIETQIRSKNQSLTDVELSVEYSVQESSYYCVLSDISERKEIDRLKDQLTAMLSHDLRTPLTALEFSLALLLKDSSGSLTDEGKGIVKTGQNNVARLINLINQLLDLYKLESRELRLYLKDMPVAGIIAPTLESIENFAESKSIDIHVEADDLSVIADPDRLTQVLINLVSNAIKYSPANSTVVISVRKPRADSPVEIRVIDSGPGIAKEYQQSIFERFYMVESSKAEKVGSSGLGLAISKAIVEAHGGTIGVESELGKGSSFWFQIPEAAPANIS
jgi:PAS domain S-box-containing protein